METQQRNDLLNLYQNSPAAFSTLRRLWAEVKRQQLRYTREQVADFLDSLHSHTEFRRRYKKPSKQRKAIAYGLDYVHQADVLFLPKRRGFIGMLVV